MLSQSSPLTSLDLGTIVSAIMMIAGAALVTWGLVKAHARGVGLSSFTARSAMAAPPPRAPPLHELSRDMDELAQRLATELDAKAGRLEQLIRDADERIAEMKALERVRDRAPVFAHAPRGRVSLESAAAPLPAIGVATAPAPSRGAASDPLSRRVYELADEGLAAGEIARTLDEQIGKVQLILALRGDR